VIRIGLVGAGHIGTVHSYALRQLADAQLVDARLVATFDDDPVRAEHVARHHGGEAYPSLDALLDAVDVVWVCTWTAGHLAAVEAAADRGLPIFCEKPLAPTFADCERVAAALGPLAARREPRARLREALAALRKSVWALSLPALVLGGMYAGVFTATEAAGAGAVLALAVGVAVYRTIGWREIWDSALDASRTSAMLFMILAGASVLGFVLTKMRVPHEIVQVVVQQDVGELGFLLAMMALLFVLGMFLETIAIILITTPVILPAMAHLGIHPIWYGVLLMINLELALITPPVGMNLFTIKAVTKAPIGLIIRGALPYVILIFVCLGIVMAWPQLALWLPGTMFK